MAGFIAMEAGGAVVGGEGNELPKPVTGALDPVTQKERNTSQKTTKIMKCYLLGGGNPHELFSVNEESEHPSKPGAAGSGVAYRVTRCGGIRSSGPGSSHLLRRFPRRRASHTVQR